MQPILAALAILAAAASVHAQDHSGSIVVSDAYIYETPPNSTSGGGYLTIENTGEAADRLLEVRADYPQVMIHESRMADGVARMGAVEGVEIAPGEIVRFAPGGLHVMFMDTGGDRFEEGESVPATLVFEMAGEVPFAFTVIRRGAAMPEAPAPMNH